MGLLVDPRVHNAKPLRLQGFKLFLSQVRLLLRWYLSSAFLAIKSSNWPELILLPISPGPCGVLVGFTAGLATCKRSFSTGSCGFPYSKRFHLFPTTTNRNTPWLDINRIFNAFCFTWPSLVSLGSRSTSARTHWWCAGNLELLASEWDLQRRSQR